jgi:hypothetical protein
LKEISWEKASNGDRILEHNDTPYGLVIGDEVQEGEVKLMLPKGKGYVAGKTAKGKL